LHLIEVALLMRTKRCVVDVLGEQVGNPVRCNHAGEPGHAQEAACDRTRGLDQNGL
jgi:hypothetical protein